MINSTSPAPESAGSDKDTINQDDSVAILGELYTDTRNTDFFGSTDNAFRNLQHYA